MSVFVFVCAVFCLRLRVDSAHLPCSDYSAINSACPVHEVGRLIPSKCDDLKTNLDDSCRDVYTEWYGRCFASEQRSLPVVLQTQLTTFYKLCNSPSGGH